MTSRLLIIRLILSAGLLIAAAARADARLGGALLRQGEALHGGDDKVVRFWDVATRRELKSLPPFELNVYDVAISPNGKTFATVTGDFKKQYTALATVSTT